MTLEESSVCPVHAARRIKAEAKVASEPEALVAFPGRLGLAFYRIGLQSGPLSQWLRGEPQRAGLPVVLIETRHVRRGSVRRIRLTLRS